MRVVCNSCGKAHNIPTKSEDVKRWRAGALIQVVMPYLTASERELLISGTCESCFIKIFGEDDE